jgi:hypothetical protein
VPFTPLLNTVFYTGTALSMDVPGKYPVALAGHPYMLDMEADQPGARGQFFRRSSIPLLRTQADNSAVPNESSVSPDDMWRYTRDSWHLGAGQRNSDRKELSSNYRFRASKGINVWTRNKASLLAGTANVLASVNNVRMVTAGTYTYLIDGQLLKYSNNITAASPSFTTVTGTPAATPTSLTTDGYTIYVAYPGGVYTTTRGAATAAISGDTNAYTLLGYVKGRLMGAVGRVLYNLTNLAAPAAALYTHPNTDFTWVGFAAGSANIYAAGYSGDKSLIYRTSVKADGTALDIPAVAGELPDGEIIRSILGYVGLVVIGSDVGVRLGQPDNNGDVTVGGLIETGTSVRCLVGYSRFVYFGWTNYDATSTGIGRLDLQNFTDTLTPAYASDIMATAQGIVGSLIVMSGTPVYAVDASGIWAPTSALVTSGYIDSGLVAYDLADPKTAMFLNVKTEALPAGATVVSTLSADGGSFDAVGTHSTTGATGPQPDYTVGQTIGETFELRHTLTRATATSTGPVLTRHTLRSYPTPSRSYEWVLPLLIHEDLDPYGSSDYPLGIAAETDYLFNLLNSLVTLQVGNQSFQVFVQDVIQLPYKITEARDAFTSTVVVQLRQPATQ